MPHACIAMPYFIPVVSHRNSPKAICQSKWHVQIRKHPVGKPGQP